MPLDSLIETIQKHQQPNKVLVVFDLDSTVFNVSPRTEHILRTLGSEPEFAKKYPKQSEVLKTITVKSTDWGIKEALIRSNVEAPLEFFEEVRNYWVMHFFSNDFLHLDQPYEGVIDYIKHLEQLGARIMYLTGRDQHRMGEGSLKSLKQHDLPVDEDHHQLILKPQKGMSDSKFKRDVFLDLMKDHTEVWLFENEPVNVNLISNEIPEVKIVFVDSVHSNREDPHEHLPKIEMQFKFTKD